MPKKGPTSAEWRQKLQAYARGQLIFGSGEKPVKGTQQEKVCKTKYSGIVCQRQHEKDGKHDC